MPRRAARPAPRPPPAATDMDEQDRVRPTSPTTPVRRRYDRRDEPPAQEKTKKRRRPGEATDDDGERKDDGPLVDDYA